MFEDFSKFGEASEDLEKAINFLEEGKFEEGEKIMKGILEKQPEFLPARLGYADFLLKMEAPWEALNIVREGKRFHSENSELRYLIAVALQKCWLLNLAEREFQTFQKQKPNDPEILRQIGWTKALKGELEEGRRLLREAINLDLMNPLPYLDLGASYALGLDFKEAFNWLETAKNLGQKESFILEKIEETKRIEKEFKKFSKKEKKTMKEMRKEPKELKLAVIENMLLISKDSPLRKDNTEDMKDELILAGLNPEMVSFHPPKTKKQKIIVEYMGYHQKVSDVERKISKEEFEEIRKKLLNQRLEENEAKKLLLILAHQGTREAINLLEDYSKKSPAELKDWVKLALEECKIFSQAKPGQIVKILHQN